MFYLKGQPFGAIRQNWLLTKGSESSLRFWVMTDTTMIDRLKQFVESEMRSCSMDIGGITPLYVYRMWGGAVAIDEIATGLMELRSQGSI